MTATRIETIAPIGRDEARRLAATEYERVVAQLRALGADDWVAPTDCPGWDVRAMAGHTVGMMQDFSSLRSVMRRMRRAARDAKAAGGPMVDSMTAQQVAEQADLSTAELVERAAAVGPRTARWRTSTPALLRRMSMKESVGGVPETWRMAYLFDVILTRDPWMHRADIARAAGRAMELTPEHDGRIVADVVGEWARRHARPCTLVLTGPAGGTFVAGDGGEHQELDAVEFCRTISGRADGAGLLTQEVPF
jgi:uncharacterized protein (TIGR03083 family)